jgi:hypothetical protein
MLKQAVLKRAITGYQGNHATANKVTVVKVRLEQESATQVTMYKYYMV